MTSSQKYHRSGYTEHLQLSQDLQRKHAVGHSSHRTIFHFLKFTPLLIIIIGFAFNFTVAIATTALAIIPLTILTIIRINRAGDKIQADCPACNATMRKEMTASTEFYVCDSCKVYGIGRDFS